MGRAGKPNIKIPFFLSGILLLLFSISPIISKAQQCPPNIDFENGNFDNWICYTGGVDANGGYNTITLFPSGGPVYDQHTMYSLATDGNMLDYYGGFPVMCPNGSNYSVRLGNTSGGAQAEGLSYEFTIPANRNTYSLIYHYAVVFQDPNHLPYQQPRMEVEVTNVTDNEVITCSSFTFFPNGSPLPGFFMSPQSDSTPVWCKDWSAVTINLNNKAGKTIKLFFKTADCTFRRHFGYAYVDVNTECSSEFTGATYCADDTAVSVTAPYGYQSYTWFNSTFTQTLGHQQTLNISPPPPAGTTYAVEIIPFDGYGCQDTLYANMIDTLTLKANAGSDAVSCNKNNVLIGAPPLPGANYSWSPVNDLSNAYISNPRAGPSVTTQYIVTVRSNGGGCINSDSVIVKASKVDTTLYFLGKKLFCITSSDTAVMLVNPTTSIQWYRNGSGLSGATLPRYKATQSGSYYSVMTNSDGCTDKTRTETVEIETPKRSIRYPDQYSIINIPEDLQARTFGQTVLWQPSYFLNNPNIVNPTFDASYELDQSYTIDIRTAAGCQTVDTQTVKVIKEVKVYVPTAFTPNNDGKNDYMHPIMLGIKELKYFRIYNRGGQLVYDYIPGAKGWDGKIGGEWQPTGVYVWMFRGTGWDKQEHVYKGTLVLIR